MRNFNSVVSTDNIYTDEDGNFIIDEFGRPIFDENAVTENVFEGDQLAAGVFLKMEFSEATLRYSTFDIDIYWAGDMYLPGALKVDSINFASDLSTDNASVSLENVTSTMPGILLNNDELDAPVTISIGSIRTSFAVYDIIQIFHGKITGWSLSDADGKATLSLSGLMALWNKKTLRIAQVSCPWPFKGTECGYTGTGRCSQQWSQCVALGNQDNYGGFIYLKDLEEKKIYWGKETPK